MPSLSTTETSYNVLRCPRCELCELNFFGVKHILTEHAFQYIKAVRNLDSANAIAKRDDAFATLRLGRKVKSDDQSVSTKVSAMEEILKIKFVKYQFFEISFQPLSICRCNLQQRVARGSCLDRDGTRNTKPERWPWKNVYLAYLWKKIANKYGKETTETLVKSTANKRKKVAYLISFGRDRKKRYTVTGRQEDGGVGVIDIESKFKALAAAWCRILIDTTFIINKRVIVF